MAKNIPPNLKRIAITRESTQDVSIPPLPEIPQSIQARFPDLKKWNAQLDEWRRTTDGLIRKVTTDLREFREPQTETSESVVIEDISKVPPFQVFWDDILGKPECFPACAVPGGPGGPPAEPFGFVYTVNGV